MRAATIRSCVEAQSDLDLVPIDGDIATIGKDAFVESIKAACRGRVLMRGVAFMRGDTRARSVVFVCGFVLP